MTKRLTGFDPWNDAVKNGEVAEKPDKEHPIATQTDGNPAPLYVSEAFAESRLRAKYPNDEDFQKVWAKLMGKDEEVTGWASRYWVST